MFPTTIQLQSHYSDKVTVLSVYISAPHCIFFLITAAYFPMILTPSVHSLIQCCRWQLFKFRMYVKCCESQPLPKGSWGSSQVSVEICSGASQEQSHANTTQMCVIVAINGLNLDETILTGCISPKCSVTLQFWHTTCISNSGITKSSTEHTHKTPTHKECVIRYQKL